MARTAGVHDLLENSLERIHRTPSEWMQFLSFQARFYRYNTTNAALIYAQRPEATACATMNYWNNRLNRWIRRGSHGIEVLQPDGESIRYIFDVADMGQQIAGIQAVLGNLTKIVIPNDSVCPGWGNATVTVSTGTAAA